MPLTTGTALIASALISAGSSAVAADRARGQSNRIRRGRETLEQTNRANQVRQDKQAKARANISNRLASSAAQRATDAGLRGRNIAPGSGGLASSVLDEGINT